MARPDPGMGEFDSIAAHLAPAAAGAPGALGLLDDAALLTPEPGRELVITTDALVEGRHFLGDESADLLARKLMRVNLSDLAAMGARPRAYFLTLVLPARRDDAWIGAFAQGFAADQAVFGGHLMGGDMVSTEGPLVLSLTAIGDVPAGQALRRNGARPGQALYVSGSLGDAALGLDVLRDPTLSPKDPGLAPLVARYHLPRPRLELGQRLRGLATAAIDISDGLVADLGHVAKASGVGLRVEANALPLSEAASARVADAPDLLEWALGGGDDYELAFTADLDEAGTVATLAEALELPLTRIGVVTTDGRVTVFDRDGGEVAVPSPGYQHF